VVVSIVRCILVGRNSFAPEMYAERLPDSLGTMTISAERDLLREMPDNQGVPSRGELHRALGLVLHHHCASCHLITVAGVPDLEADEVAAAQLAVDSQVEKGKLADPAFHLETNSKGPDTAAGSTSWRRPSRSVLNT